MALDGDTVEWKKSMMKSAHAGEIIRIKIGSASSYVTGKHTYKKNTRSEIYFKTAGEWRLDNGSDYPVSDDVEIPAGAGLILQKASTTDGVYLVLPPVAEARGRFFSFFLHARSPLVVRSVDRAASVSP